MKAKTNKKVTKKTDKGSGKLRIGNNWNAITIIALSQNNPLKAIAEFVENSIDAKAKTIQIIRGKNKGEYYLKIIDDGEGINDFKYVATHIGDSLKRQLKKKGAQGIQGEFGIGLLSFWTVGEELIMTSTGSDKITQKMKLVKNNPGYNISSVNKLFNEHGTELLIKPILPGIRQLNGEKIQNYLASELRDRISRSGVRIKIIDRSARKEYKVKPRQFTGRLLHNLPDVKNPNGEIYCELYISEPKPENSVGLYKQGTRVLPSITSIDFFNNEPWTSGYLEGIIDVPFLQLTPGTRDGIVYDGAFESFCHSISDVNQRLNEIIQEQRNADEDKASKNILSKVRKALKEAFLMLPKEEYNWLDISGTDKKKYSGADFEKTGQSDTIDENILNENTDGVSEPGNDTDNLEQKAFFEYSGPLFKAIISPSSSILGVGEKKNIRVISRDKNKRIIDSGLEIKWKIIEGSGELSSYTSEFTEFTAPEEPGITILEASVEQNEISCKAEAIMTITDQLLPKKDSGDAQSRKKGLPGYTYKNAPGELWRSRYDHDRYIIIVNNGHADFIYASKSKIRKLKYILRLFTKELVLANFPELSKEELLERMIELNLYTEENLR